ncbi:extracellular solute-binding protein [Vagococcus acidifermentans]|uniref:Sugar ABC transporter substrate-binding protein n=1 Tax=Vagococcus acidifermentans TaxID=564710 RepID=A0A430ATR8_9ENTE|nr:extracellular solute-binding protein [Vagococcus acidifermentans]RSU11446.1 sugar ABC transporter substrate-binding protein [Vagococcus acidifermentans]
MNVSFKKFGLGLLTAGLALGLAACGSDDKKKEDTAAKDTGLEISVDKGYIPYLEEIKGEFEKENNIKIKLTERDMFEQLDALSLDGPAGKAPDVMMSAYDRLGPLGQQGHLAEVKLTDDSIYNDKDKQQVTVDGKFFGAPAVIETLILYYNTELLNEAPKTFNELEEIAKDDKFAFESEQGKNVGFLAKWTDFYFSYGLIAGYGGYVFGDNGTNPQEIGLNNEGAIEGIEYAVNWFQNVWPKGMMDIKSAGDFVTDQFTKGNTAAIIDGPWAANTYKEAGVPFSTAKIPTLVNGNEYEAFGGGKAWVVSNYSKNKEVAQKFVDYVTNEANQTKLYEMTNEVPANNKSRDAAAKGDDALTQAVIAQYENASPMPNIPEMGEVWTGGENLMFDAAAGKKSVQEVADAAVQTIKESIAQKYGN